MGVWRYNLGIMSNSPEPEGHRDLLQAMFNHGHFDRFWSFLDQLGLIKANKPELPFE